MPIKNQPARLTPSQKKEQIEKIQKLVEKFRRENKLENFTAITPEQIEEKFKRVNSPMFVSQGWSGITTPGGTVTYNAYLHNPDPVAFNQLCLQLWVGSGNVDPNTGTFLLNVDTRFSRITHVGSAGFSLPAGGNITITLTLPVPSNIPKTGYMGNSCLMQLNWMDVGKYLDRGCFLFAVT